MPGECGGSAKGPLAAETGPPQGDCDQPTDTAGAGREGRGQPLLQESCGGGGHVVQYPPRAEGHELYTDNFQMLLTTVCMCACTLCTCHRRMRGINIEGADRVQSL